jgi:hypothetical protein
MYDIPIAIGIKYFPKQIQYKTKNLHYLEVFCDPAGIRTQDPYIKSVLLYQLSYGINAFLKGFAKVKHSGLNAKERSKN